MTDQPKAPQLNLSFDGYHLEIRNGKLIVKSPLPVEVHAPAVSNGVDLLVAEADLNAAYALKPQQKLKRGQYYPYQGIYLGQYDLPAPHDKNLCRKFHAFAAREPLTWVLPCGQDSINKTIFTLSEAEDYIARLRKAQESTVFNNSGVHHFDGGASVYFNPVPRIEGRMVMSLRDGQMQNGEYVGLWQQIEAGRYKGEWFIPPCDMIEDVLYGARKLSALKNSFNNAVHHTDINNKVVLSSSFVCGEQGAIAYDFATGRQKILSRVSDYAEVQLLRLAPVF